MRKKTMTACCEAKTKQTKRNSDNTWGELDSQKQTRGVSRIARLLSVVLVPNEREMGSFSFETACLIRTYGNRDTFRLEQRQLNEAGTQARRRSRLICRCSPVESPLGRRHIDEGELRRAKRRLSPAGGTDLFDLFSIFGQLNLVLGKSDGLIFDGDRTIVDPNRDFLT